MKRRCFLKSLAVVAVIPHCLANLSSSAVTPIIRVEPNPEWYTAEYETLFAFESCPRTKVGWDYGRKPIRRFKVMPDGSMKEVFPFRTI